MAIDPKTQTQDHAKADPKIERAAREADLEHRASQQRPVEHKPTSPGPGDGASEALSRHDELQEPGAPAARVEPRQTDAKPLNEIRGKASTDDRGRRVYRTLDQHHAYAEDGSELSGEEVARVQWKSDAPTWEAHQQAWQNMDPVDRAHAETEQRKQRADEARKARDKARKDVEAAAKEREAALKEQSESHERAQEHHSKVAAHDERLAEAKARLEAAHADVLKHDPADAEDPDPNAATMAPREQRQRLRDIRQRAETATRLGDWGALGQAFQDLVALMHDTVRA